MVVWDRLPHPADNEKDLQVQLVASSPDPVRVDQSHDGQPLKGGLRWTVTLQPNKPESVDYHYQLVLPAKAEVQGGNRRE